MDRDALARGGNVAFAHDQFFDDETAGCFVDGHDKNYR